MKELLTIEEVAALLRVKRKRLYDWRHRGEGPPSFRLNSGELRYPREELREWLEDQMKSMSTKEGS
jgi:excisionase family DNA binding protein